MSSSFRVGVVLHFTARHHLVGNFGPASKPHEHTYRVEAEVLGTALGQDGTLFDISRLQAALGGVVEQLAGRDLNEIQALAHPNPSAEVVAQYVFDQISPVVSGQGLRRLKTRVWESADAYSSYDGDLA